MKKIILKLINLYQITPLSSHKMCRFTPTCSEYAKQAITKYGVLKGLFLSIKRILKCHPFGKYGYDPLKENL
ncbi:MAG: membrane protein insertion efficiency factor YidD [Tenericutes bacterium]|nr:membrane protein insertion efficiency factor YidD [Mycoplasmatota bacterium]MDO4341399.1 membrane protein insertion efficiency factor YidD [bacterium]